MAGARTTDPKTTSARSHVWTTLCVFNQRPFAFDKYLCNTPRKQTHVLSITSFSQAQRRHHLDVKTFPQRLLASTRHRVLRGGADTLASQFIDSVLRSSPRRASSTSPYARERKSNTYKWGGFRVGKRSLTQHMCTHTYAHSHAGWSELRAWVLRVPAPRARWFCACRLQETDNVHAPSLAPHRQRREQDPSENEQRMARAVRV